MSVKLLPTSFFFFLHRRVQQKQSVAGQRCGALQWAQYKNVIEKHSKWTEMG